MSNVKLVDVTICLKERGKRSKSGVMVLKVQLFLQSSKAGRDMGIISIEDICSAPLGMQSVNLLQVNGGTGY